MAIDYAWEKFWAAVSEMASSRQSLQFRRADAYRLHLLHRRPDEDLPADLRDDFAAIDAALTARRATADEGDAVASALAMSDEEAERQIEAVVSLYDSISRLYGRTPDGA